MGNAVPILLVEDEPLIALSLQDALENAGYGVNLVADGAAATAFLETRDPELAGVITDIQLGPGPSGWDIARRARELNPQIPVVYTSGDSAHEHSIYGVPDSIMVQKPYASSQIITALSTLLNTVRPPGH